MRRNKLYLNFGNNWRDDFTVSVSALNLRKFTKRKIDLKKWNGKKIRVRGWLRSYNGPFMEINHPERFEPLFQQQEETPIAQEKTKKIDKGSALPTLND